MCQSFAGRKQALTINGCFKQLISLIEKGGDAITYMPRQVLDYSCNEIMQMFRAI